MTDFVITIAMMALFVYVLLKIGCFIFSQERDKCYEDMEKRGYAALGYCGGQTGGDKNTEYLNYDCIDCPYFVRTIDGKDGWKK
nr:MAG TPA_asm: hypothetical protein [Caudoviricetes sp.]